MVEETLDLSQGAPRINGIGIENELSNVKARTK